VGHLDAPDSRILRAMDAGVKEKVVSLLKFVSGLAAVCVFGVAARGDVLLDQPVDFRNRWWSFYASNVGGEQKCDDFIIDGPVVVESATFFMVATTGAREPFQWSMSVHRGYYDHPFYDFAPDYDHVFRMFNPSSVTDLGPWPGDDDMHLFEVRFDNIGLLLEPYLDDERAFWFSCAGHLRESPREECNWATAGNGVIHGDMGYYRQVPWSWPGWSLMSRQALPPSDFAMRIEGVPADEYEPSAELTGFRVINGRVVAGDAESLRAAADGDILTMHSRVRGPEHLHRAIGECRFECLLDQPDVLDVSVSGDMHTAGVGTSILYLRDWSSGGFVEVGRHSISVEIDTWPIRDIDASRFVRPTDGAIDVRFEFRIVASNQDIFLTNYFVAHFDRVRIDARRVD
jgi:hypothetical protein